jgi:DivIVA domain-containing protein
VVTVLEYLVIAAAIGLVVFVLAVLVFGRGEQMAPLSPRISPAELPDGAIAGEDVRHIRFSLALRGYRMSDVDWTLDRLSDELDRLHRRVADLGGDPLPPGVAPAALEDLFPEEESAEPADARSDDQAVLASVGARSATAASDDTSVIPRITDGDVPAAPAEVSAPTSLAPEQPGNPPSGPPAGDHRPA